MFALGCALYEIFAGQVPFTHITRDSTVIYKVLSGERPSRPTSNGLSWNVWGLTEGIWSMMELCWNADPAKRPRIETVIVELERALPSDLAQKQAEYADYLSRAEFEKAVDCLGKEEMELSFECPSETT
ncbi:hypothetical protein H0H93_013272 [Arthromyces matolae]|nr:hypothetical protein H0H93_013272 [Arthromyces matolae]